MGKIAEWVAREKAELLKPRREVATSRVTVRMHEAEFFMLGKLAEALERSKTGLAEDLLTVAIREAWDAADFPQEVQDELQALITLAGIEQDEAEQADADGRLVEFAESQGAAR
jgi:predicted GNAT family N-acyltransferase